MINKSIKIAFQRLLMFKAYSAINIGGLGIAMAVSLAILLFTFHHFSFDKYIPNGENSYRIITRYGDGTYNTNTFAAFDDVLGDYPEIESHTTIYNKHNIEDVFVNGAKIKSTDAAFVNQSFLDYFSIDVISGNRESINEPNTMMVTPEFASKLYPYSDPHGKTVLLRSFTANQDSLIAYTITAIIEPLPEASHIKIDLLLSQKGHFEPTVKIVKSRKVFGGVVYVKLYPHTDIPALEKSLQIKLEPVLGAVHGPPLEAINHHLQPVGDIHFAQGLSDEKQPTIRRSSLNILLLVGFLIFVIAIVNFVIMHIARSTYYRKSTLIIRSLGGNKNHLFLQTAIEVLLSVSLGFLIAFTLLVSLKLYLAKHYFDQWEIPFQSVEFWVISTCSFLVVVAVVSVLSSLNIVKTQTIIKEYVQPVGMKVAIPLVVFQFVMVIALTGFALLVNKQMNYIQHKELGYSGENVVAIRIPQVNEKIKLFRAELLKEPSIASTATANHFPGSKFQDMTFTTGEHSFPFKFGFIDKYAIQTLKIKPLLYTTDLKENATDGWIINRTFYNKLRSVFSDEQIATGNFSDNRSPSDETDLTDFKIIGAVDDFHYTSLHSEIENFAFFVRGPKDRVNRYVLARFEPNTTKVTIAAIHNKMEEIYPGQPVVYSFLDQQMNAQYASELLLLKLINAFSFLAIIVACLGLLGLSIFMTEKRTKEIGIRKVNGAKTIEILVLLNKDFIRWVVIAFLIATPIAYYSSYKWLQNFAFKTEISWWIFALSGLLAIIIAVITVSWQTYTASRRNPVESLRYE
jgi:putative ABC transport system permease protein